VHRPAEATAVPPSFTTCDHDEARAPVREGAGDRLVGREPIELGLEPSLQLAPVWSQPEGTDSETE
jgi:hypothetical protein